MRQASPEGWQRRYYAHTARDYDQQHLGPDREHDVALALMAGALDHLGARSVLDVGSGTGRVIQFLNQRRAGVLVKGVGHVALLGVKSPS